MSETDWRKILVAYIAHVETCEGCIFLPGDQGDLAELGAEERALLSETAADATDPANVHLVKRLRESASELREGTFS